MTTPAPAVAARLEQVVRGVPSVRALYRPWWAMAGHGVAAALGLEDEENPLVTVGMLPDGSMDVTAAIAATAGAAETCRAVHDAIARDLRERGHPDATIHITVAQVAPSTPEPRPWEPAPDAPATPRAHESGGVGRRRSQNTGRPPVTPSTVPDT